MSNPRIGHVNVLPRLRSIKNMHCDDDCLNCDSTGYVCDTCWHAEGDCICTGEEADLQEFIPCEECGNLDDFDE